jgi:AraC family transcriptional regulator
VNAALLSLQVYESSYFTSFNPNNKFEKWAAIEVSDFGSVPEEIDSFTLTSGLYAVFKYKGLSTDDRIFQYIFMTWLPNSTYQLDSRPHFEILGERYKNNDPNSEEEIWIPVREK